MIINRLRQILQKNIIGKVVVLLTSYLHTLCSLFTFQLQKYLRIIGISDDNLKSLQKFKNKYKDKRCFVIATGPSLKISDLEKLNNEITFGMNSVCYLYEKTDWRPTFYGIQDGVALDRVKTVLMNQESSHYFFNYKYRRKVEKNLKSLMSNNRVSFFPLNYKLHGSRLDYKTQTKGFSNDIYKEVIDGYTITYTMIQIAVYMGFKEIYLLGCDNSFSKPGAKHFFKHEDDEKVSLNRWKLIEKRMTSAYKEAKQFADKNGIKIINATRGGNLEEFPRVDFDEINFY